MLLPLLIIVLMISGVVAGVVSHWQPLLSRWISLLAVMANLVMVLVFWYQLEFTVSTTGWLLEFYEPWIPSFGVSFHLAMDGLSLLMLILTFFLGALGILTSWTEIQHRVGFFHFNILWVLAGITGVFITMDLFLFYFFWEVMLIPMYFLIGIWGHENRQYAAYKFFIFTQASGLLMLLSILALYFIHGAQTQDYTFDYFRLLGTSMSGTVSLWIMLGFLAAFMVKLPVFPFHTWLPDAHTEAPTAGSLILAGLLLKTGAYGLIRFVVPLFPSASVTIAPWAMLLGTIGIIYGGIQAYSQTDLKRLIAYTSVSHMGFIMLGVFAFNETAMQGVVLQMITHGISTGALFIIAGGLYQRIHTRNVLYMGGLWPKAPFMGVVAMVFAMASLGLPGLGNFIAEFLTLIGAWKANRVLTILATAGLVIATAYSLRIVQKIFLGTPIKDYTMPDLSLRERIIMIPLVVTIVVLGLFPQAVINTAGKTVSTSLTEAKNEVERRGTQPSGVGYKSFNRKGGSHDTQ